MKKDMGKIQFESRYEIDEVANALATFMKEHPDAREKETVEMLKGLLDVMYMSW